MTADPLPATTGSAGKSPSRLALWLHFPRRIFFLVLAAALAYGLISLIRISMDFPANGPDLGDVLPRLQNTLRLFNIVLPVSFLLSLVTLVIASFVLRLESRPGFWGGFLRALGRLWIFSDITMPAFALGTFLIWLFAFRLELLPPFGMVSPTDDSAVDRLRHIILPVLSLVFFPAGMAALSAARRMHASAATGFRRWAGGILRLLAAFFRQVGGILSAMILVEIVFAWPGVLRMLYQSVMMFMIPVMFEILPMILGLVLIGRLLADIFEGFAVIVDPSIAVPPPPDPRLKKARRGWLIFTLVLLTVAVLIVIVGLFLSESAVTGMDLSDAPSTGPLGADFLGRNILARLVRGASNTFRVSFLVSLLVTVVAFPIGWLAGWFARRRLGFHILSDLLLLPADALLLLPAVGAYILFYVGNMEFIRNQGAGILPIILFLVAIVLPRATRFMATLWTTAPDHPGFLHFINAGFSLFLSALFTAFSLLTAVSYLGLGLRPPVTSLGGVLADIFRVAIQAGWTPAILLVLAIGFFLWVLFLAAEALLEGWQDKSAFSWFHA